MLYKRNRRFRKFEELFPEALDLLTRAVKAGHAFNTGIEMIADEMPEPIAKEFRITYDEQNFGLPLKQALFNMVDRVPLLDLKFFVTAVMMQKETGGNLAEILTNLSHVIRERFKIMGEVRTFSAQGRLTGYILTAVPIAHGFHPFHDELGLYERSLQRADRALHAGGGRVLPNPWISDHPQDRQH